MEPSTIDFLRDTAIQAILFARSQHGNTTSDIAPLKAQILNADPHQVREALRQTLTQLNLDLPGPLTSNVERLLAAEVTGEAAWLSERERRERRLVTVTDLLQPSQSVDGSEALTYYHSTQPRGEGRVVLWKGDITRLQVDGIVNAANSQLLGCFQPTHRCIDNVIHDRAGPELRAECRRLVEEERRQHGQGWEEPVGSAKVTSGFSLPSKYVIHTVGPAAEYKGQEQPELLASCYRSVLDATSSRGMSSVAFCCISTGLFGYPRQAACRVASSAVKSWLSLHPSSTVKTVVFNVFTPEDYKVYAAELPRHFCPVKNNGDDVSTQQHHLRHLANPTISPDVPTAAKWFKEADAVLVCAGAGMSAQDGYNVYVDEDDFAKWYPGVPRYGYNTSYECMGLFMDGSVPDTVKWGYQASHMNNQRWKFPVNDGYSLLKRLIGDKDYFVHTSNVDGCFDRSGLFDPARIYTPQGDWSWYQCKKKCRPDSVWSSREMLDKVIPNIDPLTQQLTSAEHIPKCRNCGGDVFGNVRGGGWFLHHAAYQRQQRALIQWLEGMNTPDKRLLVVEIGAGFNTPTVTRFPMESIVREMPAARLLRINVADSDVPRDLEARGAALGMADGWKVLRDVQNCHDSDISSKVTIRDKSQQADQSVEYHRAFAKRYGHFDWRVFLRQLS